MCCVIKLSLRLRPRIVSIDIRRIFITMRWISIEMIRGRDLKSCLKVHCLRTCNRACLEFTHCLFALATYCCIIVDCDFDWNAPPKDERNDEEEHVSDGRLNLKTIYDVQEGLLAVYH